MSCFAKSTPKRNRSWDIAHACACALKRQLNGEESWQNFLKAANKAKTAIRQTPLAFLMPPEIKAKARWMNLEPLIAWSGKVLQFLESPQEVCAQAKVDLDLEKVSEKLGWLWEYQEDLVRWSRMLEVCSVSLKYVRNQGYHSQAGKGVVGPVGGVSRGWLLGQPCGK